MSFLDVAGNWVSLPDSHRGTLGGFLFAHRQFLGMSESDIQREPLAIDAPNNSVYNITKYDACYNAAIEYVLGNYKEGTYHSQLKENGYRSFVSGVMPDAKGAIRTGSEKGTDENGLSYRDVSYVDKGNYLLIGSQYFYDSAKERIERIYG